MRIMSEDGCGIECLYLRICQVTGEMSGERF
jgi:hypothetical protein